MDTMNESIAIKYNGIKVGKGKLQKAWMDIDYSSATVSVYAKGYEHFSDEIQKEFEVNNESDLMTDYFDKDKFVIKPSTPYHLEAIKACKAGELTSLKRNKNLKDVFNGLHTDEHILSLIKEDTNLTNVFEDWLKLHLMVEDFEPTTKEVKDNNEAPKDLTQQNNKGQNMNAVNTEVQEVALEVNEKSIPVWVDENGVVIPQLTKAHFLNEDVTKEDRKEAEIEFTKYMIECKKINHAKAQEKADSLKEAVADYTEKLDVLVNGESEESKMLRAEARLKKQMASLQAKMAEMGLGGDDADLDEED